MKKSLFLALLLSSCSIGPPAYAAMLCGPENRIGQAIMDQFKEFPIARGIIGEGTGVVRLFKNAKGDFTITTTDGKGLMCFLLVGTDWEENKLPVPGRGA